VLATMPTTMTTAIMAAALKMVIRALHDAFRHRRVAIKVCESPGPGIESAAATAVEARMNFLRIGLM
jgi:hypothetical protein